MATYFEWGCFTGVFFCVCFLFSLLGPVDLLCSEVYIFIYYVLVSFPRVQICSQSIACYLLLLLRTCIYLHTKGFCQQ